MNEQQFNSLPVEQRKIAQQRLIDLGLYNGAADGKWGAGTKAAFEMETKRADEEAKGARAEKLKQEELSIKRLEAEAGKTKTDAEAAEQAAKTSRKQAYDEQAGSAAGLAAQIAASSAAPATGYFVGRGIGSGLNWAGDRSQTSKNAVLQGAADDRVAGLTTREGARIGAERSGAMPSSSSGLRVAGRMLPHAITGAAMLGKGGALLASGNEDEPFWPSTVNRGLGLGMLGAGAGILEQGANYAVNPGVAPDARAIAVMESNQLRRNGAAARGPGGPTIDLTAEEIAPARAEIEGPAKTAPTPGSKDYLRQQAKDLGIKGLSKMSKAQLAEALATTMSEHGGKRTVAKRLPKPPGGATGAAIAGALGYAMTPDEANAATGEPSGDRTKALTNAAIAGGGAYSVSRLAQALMPSARGALSMVGDAAAPVSIDSMTDYTPDDLAQGRNMLARNLPSFLRGGAVEDAYQMAQVPERNPARGEEEPPYYDAGAQPEPASPGGISPSQMQRLQLALASQGVAGRGEEFPQPDDRTRRLAEALMGGAY